MRRSVIDGERLSGHRQPGAVGYPQIDVRDGEGLGGGSRLFSIDSFHWADVVVNGDTTELWFENKVCVTISDGLVQYSE